MRRSVQTSQVGVRRTDDFGWVVTIAAPLESFPCGDPVIDAARVNRALESQIRRAVDEYLWVHRRFKTRPPGEDPAYKPAEMRERFRRA